MLQTKIILELIEIYKPSRITLHNLIYLYTFKYGLTPCFEDCDWRLTYTGMYCPEIEDIVSTLIEKGLVRVCRDSSLTTGECTDAASQPYKAVIEAMKTYNTGRNR